MKIALLSFPGGSYAGSGELARRWHPGEVRELSDEAAGYLLATFPGCFALVADEPVDPVAVPESELPEAPVADRMVRKGRKRA